MSGLVRQWSILGPSYPHEPHIDCAKGPTHTVWPNRRTEDLRMGRVPQIGCGIRRQVEQTRSPRCLFLPSPKQLTPRTLLFAPLGDGQLSIWTTAKAAATSCAPSLEPQALDSSRRHVSTGTCRRERTGDVCFGGVWSVQMFVCVMTVGRHDLFQMWNDGIWPRSSACPHQGIAMWSRLAHYGRKGWYI